MLLPPCVPSAVPGRDVFSPRLLRQLWGLTVRCERAMRAIAPHWHAQKASWGEAGYKFEILASSAHWLCQFADSVKQHENGQSLPEPVIQLLASSMATILKAARITGVNADYLLPCRFVILPALRQSITGASPATISLLLPRMAGSSNVKGAVSGVSPALFCAVRAMDTALILSQWKGLNICPLAVLGSCHMAALVSRVVAELLGRPGSATTRHDAHFAFGRLGRYVACISAHIFDGATQICVGDPSALSQMRDLLARPLLHLLHFPLLDTLVALQHVMIRASPSTKKTWETASTCQTIPLQALMEADAMDSKVAMQVGHIYYSMEP